MDGYTRKKATRAEAKEERCRQKALDVMEAVRAFGKMPRFQMRPLTKEAKQENQLRRQLDIVLKQKRLNANELAELDEFKWMCRREDEWKAIARAQQQKETKKYKAELRARLGESECRCTCYKFKHWEGLWRQDRAKATRLRQQGWHLVGVCALLGIDPPFADWDEHDDGEPASPVSKSEPQSGKQKMKRILTKSSGVGICGCAPASTICGAAMNGT